MHYLGGKYRIRHVVADYLTSLRQPGQTYWEPFVGAAWVLQEMADPRIASDACDPLITLYLALQRGWLPPAVVSEQDWQRWRFSLDNNDPMRAFAGFGCSFSGKWFGGYARSAARNYALNARNSLLKQLPKIKTAKFVYGDYAAYEPVDLLIYCDPPYQGTTDYGYFQSFDHDRFWDVVRRWSHNNTVIVSEYSAPDDFVCVLEIPTKTDMRVAGNKEARSERLFRLNT